MVICRNCGIKGLSWRETLVGFKLCDDFGIHKCEKRYAGGLKNRKTKNS